MTFAGLPVSVLGWTVKLGHGVREFEGRGLCIVEAVSELQSRGVGHVVIESRGLQDSDDVATIHRSRRRQPSLVFEHKQARDEPLLWIADGAAWTLGAGPGWSRLLADVLIFHKIIGP